MFRGDGVAIHRSGVFNGIGNGARHIMINLPVIGSCALNVNEQWTSVSLALLGHDA